MKNKLLILMFIFSLYGCGQSNNTPDANSKNTNIENTTTSTPNESTAPDLKKELQIQNQPNISIIDKLNQSESVVMCANYLYEADKGTLKFYEYSGLSADDTPILKEIYPSFAESIKYDPNTFTFTWKAEYKILDKRLTRIEQLLVNEKEFFIKDSITNQVNVMKCKSFKEFMNQLQDLKKLEKFVDDMNKK